jgi:hypothetical protein
LGYTVDNEMGVKDRVMNENAVAVLRKIYECGLLVRWEYRVPYPRYGRDYTAGNPVPTDEWDIIENELGRDRIEGMVVYDDQPPVKFRTWVSRYLNVETVEKDDEYVMNEYVLTLTGLEELSN